MCPGEVERLIDNIMDIEEDMLKSFLALKGKTRISDDSSNIRLARLAKLLTWPQPVLESYLLT